MRRITLLLLLLGMVCQACAIQEPSSTQIPLKDQTVEATAVMPALPTPATTIDPLKQRNRVVTVTVGDVFAVTVPPGSSKWTVDYANSVVQLLTSGTDVNEPGPQGWLFRAVAVGSTDIRLTSVLPACNSPTPCPPAPPVTIVFTVEVK